MDEKQQYLEAIKKRALGYEYEETQTLIEETKTGQKKKIVKTKKHIPPDVASCRWLLSKLEPKQELEELFERYEKDLKEVMDKWK